MRHPVAIWEARGPFFIEDSDFPGAANYPTITTPQRLLEDIRHDADEWVVRRKRCSAHADCSLYYEIYRPDSKTAVWYGRGLALEVLYSVWKHDTKHARSTKARAA